MFNNQYNIGSIRDNDIDVNNNNKLNIIEKSDMNDAINMAKKFCYIENLDLHDVINNDAYIQLNNSKLNRQIDINYSNSNSDSNGNIIDYIGCVNKIMYIQNFNNQYDKVINSYNNINTLSYLIYQI